MVIDTPEVVAGDRFRIDYVAADADSDFQQEFSFSPMKQQIILYIYMIMTTMVWQLINQMQIWIVGYTI